MNRFQLADLKTPAESKRTVIFLSSAHCLSIFGATQICLLAYSLKSEQALEPVDDVVDDLVVVLLVLEVAADERKRLADNGKEHGLHSDEDDGHEQEEEDRNVECNKQLPAANTRFGRGVLGGSPVESRGRRSGAERGLYNAKENLYDGEFRIY